ncbi:MAG: hypothetical protein ABIO67_07540 [Mycobacteriales bacterium]
MIFDGRDGGDLIALAEIGARLRLEGASRFQRDASKSAKSIGGIGKSASKTERQISKLDKAASRLGKVVGGGLVGGALFAGFKSAVSAASDMNESLSKSQAVFGKSAVAVQSWAKDSTKNILLTRQAAIEGAGTFGNLFVAMGVGQEPAAKLSTTLVGLAADLSSFNNVPTEDALLSLRSGLLGEAEPLRKFGVQLSAARIEAEALALGIVKPTKNMHAIAQANVAVAVATNDAQKVIKKYGANSLKAASASVKVQRAQDALAKATKGSKTELTAAQKAQAAYSIIMKDTKTAQGDAARTSGGYANATRILQKKLADARVEIGQKLLPVALRLTTSFSKLIDEFKAGKGAGGEIRDVLQDIGRALKWMNDHRNVMATLAVGMGTYKVAVWGAAAGQKSLATWMAITNKTPVTPGGKTPLVGPLPLALGAAAAYGIGALALHNEKSDSNIRNLKAGNPTATIKIPGGQKPVTFDVPTPRRSAPFIGPVAPSSKSGMKPQAVRQPIEVKVMIGKAQLGAAMADIY